MSTAIQRFHFLTQGTHLSPLDAKLDITVGKVGPPHPIDGVLRQFRRRMKGDRSVKGTLQAAS